ncbi:MAG: RecX family transcriptional regulator [Bacilli bacterium]|nr:RecX family transcriptional regulator [Bacilli bacterium]
MQINKIKKMSNYNYRIIFTDDTYITLCEDLILKNNLLYKKTLDKKTIENLLKENEYYDLYDKCINYINKKMRSKKEILDYIRKYTINETYINNIINKLESIKLINDELYTKSFIQDKLYLSPNGPIKIKNELIQNNIDISIINKYMEDIDEQVIHDKLKKIIEKKIKIDHKNSTNMLKQKILYSMLNLGYEKSQIIEILNNANFNNNIMLDYQKIIRKGIFDKRIIKNKLYQKGYNMDEIEEIIKKMD